MFRPFTYIIWYSLNSRRSLINYSFLFAFGETRFVTNLRRNNKWMSIQEIILRIISKVQTRPKTCVWNSIYFIPQIPENLEINEFLNLGGTSFGFITCTTIPRKNTISVSVAALHWKNYLTNFRYTIKQSNFGPWAKSSILKK